MFEIDDDVVQELNHNELIYRFASSIVFACAFSLSFLARVLPERFLRNNWRYRVVIQNL